MAKGKLHDDGRFKNVSYQHTDLAATFKRERERLAKAEKKTAETVVPIASKARRSKG